MCLKIVVLVYITSFLLIRFAAMSENNSGKRKCLYDQTVDLTEAEQNANGSYLYNDTEIPADLVDIYDYEILENGTEITRNHTRGCICTVKRCLNFCSDSWKDFYNLEDISQDEIDWIYTKNVTLANGTEREFHLIDDFHNVVRPVCQDYTSLDPELRASDKWTLFEDGTLLRHGDGVNLTQEEYCFDVRTIDAGDVVYFLINPYYCSIVELPLTFYLNAYNMFFSIPFFMLTIVFYCCMDHLRNTHGKCFIAYLSSLAVSYSLISILIISRWKLDPIRCRVYGYSIYFTVISYLTWNCVISYDTWKTLKNVASNSSFWKYSKVGWSVPLLMTLLTYAAQNYLPYDDLKPGINDSSCSVNTDRWSACIYFYVPAILMLIYSLTLYIKVIWFIIRNSRDVKAYKVDVQKSQKKRFLLYFRLFVFMGVSWFFDILSYFLNMLLKEHHLTNYVVDFFNASQGIFIFLTFCCRRKMWRTVLEKKKRRGTPEHRIIARTYCTEFAEDDKPTKDR